MTFPISWGPFMRFDYRCKNTILILFLIRQAIKNVSLLGFPNLIERKFPNPTSAL